MTLDDVVVPAWEEPNEYAADGKCTYPAITLRDLLECLIEEAAEVGKAAAKILRFGWDRSYAGYGSNADQLAGELGDVMALIGHLPFDRRMLTLRDAAIVEKLRNVANHKKRFLAEGGVK